MSFNSLEKFIELAKKEGVSSLKYENEDEKFEVAFPFASAELMAPSRSNLTHTPSVSSPAPLKEAGSDAHVIKSPFVGTFYSSSSPGEAAFVKVGDKVASGTVLCILEAMKIMNEIEADVSGEVLEVCVENESLVEYGQPLFKIRK